MIEMQETQFKQDKHAGFTVLIYRGSKMKLYNVLEVCFVCPSVHVDIHFDLLKMLIELHIIMQLK